MDGRKLAAALLVCLSFGSIHAYGVLLSPLEQWLGTSRTVGSLGYSLALAALTAGVYLNGRLEHAFSPPSRLFACGATAALGLCLATATSSVAGLLIGFGLMFGLANGIAYSVSLGMAAAAMPERAARAMGLATAVYGLGAVLSAQFFAAILQKLHVSALLLILAPIVFLACVFAAALVAKRDRQPEVSHSPDVPPPKGLLLLWAAYLLAAIAGLMVLAHAPAIALWRGGSDEDSGMVSGIVSLGSVVGGYLGGVTAERLGARISLALPVLVQAIVLGLLPLVPSPGTLLVMLGLVGLCYGAVISAIPAEVRRMAGGEGFAANYGRVFTAWGIAGIAGPIMAGRLYDLTRDYDAALVTASALSLASCLLLWGARPTSHLAGQLQGDVRR